DGHVTGVQTCALPICALDIRLKNKKAGTEARSKAGYGLVPNTKPSHPISDYVGEYEHPAYGILKIGLKDNQLQFEFHKIRFPMRSEERRVGKECKTRR